MKALGPGRARNPFSVQGLGPDGAPYLFAGNGSAATWLAWVLAHPEGAEIVAPQGFGKSTLARTIAAQAVACGLPTVLWRLHEHDRRPPRGAPAHLLRVRLLVIDGAEQWPRPVLLAIRALLRARGAALLLTAHAPLRIGAVRELVPSGAAIARMVAERTGTMVDGEALLARHGGNARELFSALYAEWEREGRLGACGPLLSGAPPS